MDSANDILKADEGFSKSYPDNPRYKEKLEQSKKKVQEALSKFNPDQIELLKKCTEEENKEETIQSFTTTATNTSASNSTLSSFKLLIDLPQKPILLEELPNEIQYLVFKNTCIQSCENGILPFNLFMASKKTVRYAHQIIAEGILPNFKTLIFEIEADGDRKSNRTKEGWSKAKDNKFVKILHLHTPFEEWARNRLKANFFPEIPDHLKDFFTDKPVLDTLKVEGNFYIDELLYYLQNHNKIYNEEQYSDELTDKNSYLQVLSRIEKFEVNGNIFNKEYAIKPFYNIIIPQLMKNLKILKYKDLEGKSVEVHFDFQENKFHTTLVLDELYRLPWMFINSYLIDDPNYKIKKLVIQGDFDSRNLVNICKKGNEEFSPYTTLEHFVINGKIKPFESSVNYSKILFDNVLPQMKDLKTFEYKDSKSNKVGFYFNPLLKEAFLKQFPLKLINLNLYAAQAFFEFDKNGFPLEIQRLIMEETYKLSLADGRLPLNLSQVSKQWHRWSSSEKGPNFPSFKLCQEVYDPLLPLNNHNTERCIEILSEAQKNKFAKTLIIYHPSYNQIKGNKSKMRLPSYFKVIFENKPYIKSLKIIGDYYADELTEFSKNPQKEALKEDPYCQALKKIEEFEVDGRILIKGKILERESFYEGSNVFDKVKKVVETFKPSAWNLFHELIVPNLMKNLKKIRYKGSNLNWVTMKKNSDLDWISVSEY